MNDNAAELQPGPLRDAEARREVSALCEGVRAALEAVEGARLLEDDTPELALEALARWSEGSASAEELEELVEEIGDAFRYSLEKAKISEASLRETATRAEREAQSATARVAEIAAAQEAMRKALP